MDLYLNAHHIHDSKALRVFVHDATRIASKLSKAVARGETKTFCLFADERTGRVAMWCRADDPAAYPMSARHDIRFDPIHWQIRGSAKRDEDATTIHKRF